MSVVTGVTSGFFPNAQDGFTTTLAANASYGATTISLNSAGIYGNGDTVVLILEPSLTTKNVVTGLMNTTTSPVTVINCVWTEGGNNAHNVGAVVYDYVTATHVNLMRKGFGQQHNLNTGAHGNITATSITNAGNESVGGTLTVTGGAALSGGTTLATGDIQANELSSSAITLGYAQITTNFSTGSGTAVLVTGLSVTVTIPVGGRYVRITAYATNVGGSTGTAQAAIWDGAVGTGTSLAAWNSANNLASGMNMQAIVQPSAGSKTYNISLLSTNNSVTLGAATGQPAFILVEAI